MGKYWLRNPYETFNIGDLVWRTRGTLRLCFVRQTHEQGNGTVTERLYQLIREPKPLINCVTCPDTMDLPSI
jgi:hypothetical protein